MGTEVRFLRLSLQTEELVDCSYESGSPFARNLEAPSRKLAECAQSVSINTDTLLAALPVLHLFRYFFTSQYHDIQVFKEHLPSFRLSFLAFFSLKQYDSNVEGNPRPPTSANRAGNSFQHRFRWMCVGLSTSVYYLYPWCL